MSAIIKIFFCLSLLILCAFVQVPLLQYNSVFDKFVFFNYSLAYISCFVSSIAFKNNYVFVAVMIYLLAGIIGLPVFAFGGGFRYIMEPGFGYLLGLIPLTVIAFYYQVHLPDSPIKILGTNIVPLLGIVVAHLCGLGFLLITFRFSFENFLNLSGMQLVYDLLLGFLALVFIKPQAQQVQYH